MDKEKATQLIVKELGRYRSRNDLIVALCERMGLDWHEAELLVQEVESRHARAIAARQSPLMVTLGIGIILAGAWLAIQNTLYLINFFQTPHNMLSVMGALELRSVYLRAGALFTGLAMIAGGTIGSWQFFSRLLK